MNLDLKTLPAKVTPLLAGLRKYLIIIFIVFFAGLYGFLLMRINSLASSTPTEDAVTERLKTVKRPRIDQDAANKIQQLEDQNLQVQSLFDQARQNPFAE